MTETTLVREDSWPTGLRVAQVRVARPTDKLAQVEEFYAGHLGLPVLYRFVDHDGFDGVMLGHPGGPYHLEFTRRDGHHAGVAPTQDNLLVFYVPELAQWQAACARMLAAGFRPVVSFNPYWDREGRTFEDLDGYRVVLQNAGWAC